MAARPCFSLAALLQHLYLLCQTIIDDGYQFEDQYDYQYDVDGYLWSEGYHMPAGSSAAAALVPAVVTTYGTGTANQLLIVLFFSIEFDGRYKSDYRVIAFCLLNVN
jgi:hypothetical protein